MKLTTNTLGVIVTGVAMVLTVLMFLLFLQSARPAHADNAFTSTMFKIASTTTTVSVTTSTLILGTSTPASSGQRVYADICNPSSKAVVLMLDQGKPANASTSGGIWLQGGTCFDITPQKLYTGAITASSSDQSSVGLLVNNYEE